MALKNNENMHVNEINAFSNNFGEIPDKLTNQLVQMIPSGIAIFDLNKNSISREFMNDGFYNMLGAKREQRDAIYGKEILNSIHPKDIPGILLEARQSITENRMFNYSFRILDNKKHYIWVNLKANHIKLPSGAERFYASYNDINKLINVQKQLTENEAIFKEALIYSEMLYFIYHPDTHECSFPVKSRIFKKIPCRIHEFPESLAGHSVFSDEDINKIKTAIDHINAGSAEEYCELRIKSRNVNTWYKLHLINRSDKHKKCPFVIGYLINIDAFKSAQKELSDENIRLNSLQGGILVASCFNVTADTIVDIRYVKKETVTDDILSSIMKEAEESYPLIAKQNAWTRNCLLSTASYIPDKKSRMKFIQSFSHFGFLDAYKNGKLKMEYEYQRIFGGNLIWVLTKALLVNDPETSELYAFLYTYDINETKIVNTAKAMLINYTFDSAGIINVQDLSIKSLEENPCSNFKFYGTDSYSTVLDMYINRYIHVEDKKQCSSALKLTNIVSKLSSQTAFSCYFRESTDSDTSSGSYCKHVKFNTFYLNSEQKYIVITKSDITEMYKQEMFQEQMLENALDKARKASSAKSDFLSRVSHDIRTPLNGIIGMTNLALDKNIPDDIRKYLINIDKCSHFLLSLVNDILDLRKVETGNLELHPEPYSFKEFKEYISAVIVPLCVDKGINFAMETDESPIFDSCIFADKLRINQIFFNLLSNAVKFTDEGGNVDFHIESLPDKDDRISLKFAVKDNGIGIKPEFMDKIFTPFEQQYNGISSERSGSGLGLSIVKKLVELMKGSISVESTPGCGSTFTVVLSFNKISFPPDSSFPSDTTLDLSGKKILIVEDNEINAEIVCELLTNNGAHTETAKNGEIAVKLFNESPEFYYDFILMDIRMPVMDGLTASRCIRSLTRKDALQTPIIAMTANAFDDDIKECLASGINAHIAKPLSTKRLFAVMHKYIKKI
jgi:signal transduction histidine kinase/CheY-like chemotaxis protein